MRKNENLKVVEKLDNNERIAGGNESNNDNKGLSSIGQEQIDRPFFDDSVYFTGSSFNLVSNCK